MKHDNSDSESISAFDLLQTAWKQVEARFMSSAPIRRLGTGDITVAHYASYLRETYFYTREDPQIQAVCTAYFKGADREMVKPFLQHATSEVGHDQMALDDMAALGFATDHIRDENPLPNTIALTAFAYYGLQYRTPHSYLGHLFFLEFLPTSQGGKIAAALKQLGVPDQAMSFLTEHNTVDVHHNRLMKIYADHMLRSQADVDEVVYAMEVTGRLFEGMLAGAFEAVDAGRARLIQATVEPQKVALEGVS